MGESDSGDPQLDRILAAAYRNRPDAAPARFQAPELSRFEDVRPLGKGGMGEVFVARDRVLERTVALKLIQRGLRQRDEVRARFLREARILSRLEHPNVCLLYDYVQSEREDVLVMEWIQGETLARHLEDGMGHHRALGIAEGIAAALSAAHGAGIVHRDLKPANVMITPEGVPKVLDFGIARSHSGTSPPESAAPEVSRGPQDAPEPRPSDPALTARGQILGTPAYMSPEQRRGEAASPASDLYSFGLILSDLLRPEHPLAQALLNQDPRERPTAADARRQLQRLITRPRRLALRALGLGVVVAFAFLGARYLIDVRRERDHALDRQARAERLIAFLVERVAGRIEDVGPRSLIEAVDEEAARYFRGDPDTPFSETELRRRVQALSGYARRVRTYGRLETAKSLYTEVEAFLEGLPESQRKAPEWQFELGQVRFYLGEIARDEGHHDLTRAYWSSYAEISQQLVEAAPREVLYLDELAYARTNLGVFHFEQSHPEAASTLFAQALAHWESRARNDPRDVELELECADALSWVAESLGASGRLLEACAAFEREVRLRLELLEEDPASLTWLHRLVLAEHHHGRALQRAGRRPEALSVLRSAHDRAESLASADPERAPWLRTRVLVASSLGALLEDMDRTAEARPIHDEARAGIEALQERDPDNGDWTSLAAHVLLRCARNRERLGQAEAASGWLEKVRRRLEDGDARIKGVGTLRARAAMLAGDLSAPDTQEYQRALDELGPWGRSEPPEEANLRARLLLRLGRFDEARPLVEALMESETLSGAAEREWTIRSGTATLPASVQDSTR